MYNQHQHIKLDYLELMAGDDPKIRQTLLELLLSDLRTELPRMRDLFEAEDWAELYRSAHKMKSTLDYSGNEAMQQANLNILSHSGDQHDPAEVGRALQQLEALSIAVLVELEAIIQ